MLIRPASMAGSAERGITDGAICVSVPGVSPDSTVRRKWTNVPHCPAQMGGVVLSMVTSANVAVTLVSPALAVRSTSTSVPVTPAPTEPPVWIASMTTPAFARRVSQAATVASPLTAVPPHPV